MLAGQKLGIKDVDRACPDLIRGHLAHKIHAL
ncbi:hypothetical protein SFHH103_02677 [Sinorhizobium fredii HH103]|uniref:Uncharacterized protein n=1 Tax=Sinorhizobium fredii (strain HH103) TaxID=1117943 RepID=G9AB81_SINF1|nr:hypothetical protein SFHH103_02677 [Sinorhizobium fredii HH103]